jgi:hypothetical protein
MLRDETFISMIVDPGVRRGGGVLKMEIKNVEPSQGMHGQGETGKRKDDDEVLFSSPDAYILG